MRKFGFRGNMEEKEGYREIGRQGEAHMEISRERERKQKKFKI